MSHAPPSLQQLRAAKSAAKERFAALAGVNGVGIGDGCVRLYVHDARVRDELPATVEGIAIEVVTTGEVRALPAPGA